MREILVTGAAAVTALGRDLETTAARLAAGESACVEVTAEEAGPRRRPAFAARIATFTTEPEMPRAKEPASDVTTLRLRAMRVAPRAMPAAPPQTAARRPQARRMRWPVNPMMTVPVAERVRCRLPRVNVSA